MVHPNSHIQDGIHILNHGIMHHQLNHLHIRMKERQENYHRTHCTKKIQIMTFILKFTNASLVLMRKLMIATLLIFYEEH